jgi:hypothetical protein
MDEKTYKVYYFCAAYALVICLAFFNTYIWRDCVFPEKKNLPQVTIGNRGRI